MRSFRRSFIHPFNHDLVVARPHAFPKAMLDTCVRVNILCQLVCNQRQYCYRKFGKNAGFDIKQVNVCEKLGMVKTKALCEIKAAQMSNSVSVSESLLSAVKIKKQKAKGNLPAGLPASMGDSPTSPTAAERALPALADAAPREGSTAPRATEETDSEK